MTVTNYANEGVATKVYGELEGFVDQFKQMSEGGQLERLCDSEEFVGANIGQSPEDFTERTLVEPMLRALGYADRNETDSADGACFRRRPSTFESVELNRPDYLLDDVNDSLTCLLEVKKINDEQENGPRKEATDDLKDYVADDTFCKTVYERDNAYLLGLGTDGFRWTHFLKDLDTGAVSQAETRVDISPVVAAIARERDVIRGDPDLGWRESVTHLADGLVDRYGANNLPSIAETR